MKNVIIGLQVLWCFLYGTLSSKELNKVKGLTVDYKRLASPVQRWCVLYQTHRSVVHRGCQVVLDLTLTQSYIGEVLLNDTLQRCE